MNRDINKTLDYSTTRYPFYKLSYLVYKGEPAPETVTLTVTKKGKRCDKERFIADSPYWIFSVFPDLVLSAIKHLDAGRQVDFKEVVFDNKDVYDKLTLLERSNLVEICNMYLQVEDDNLGLVPNELYEKLKDYDETDYRHSRVSK